MTDTRTPSAVRFSTEERKLIQQAADEAGMAMTTYVRVAALEKAKAAKRIISKEGKR